MPGGPGDPPPTAHEAPPRGRSPAGEAGLHALHAAWLGRAVGCLLGKPVEKLPLHAIRALARATGNWPLSTWFTAKGLPPELAAAHPWNRRSAATSLAENIDGMPEDDDLNYPLLNLLLLQRHGKAFTTAQLGGLWLDELPAGRTFTAERIAYRNLLDGIEPPLHRRPPQPLPGVDRRRHPRRCARLDAPRRPRGRRRPGASRRRRSPTPRNGVYGAMFIAAAIATAAGGTADVHERARGRAPRRPPALPPRPRRPLRHRHRPRRAGLRHASSTACTPSSATTTGSMPSPTPPCSPPPSRTPTATSPAPSAVPSPAAGTPTPTARPPAPSPGLLAGHPDELPDRWTAPLKNRLATSVAGFDGIGFDTLAHLTHQEALRP